MDTEEKIISKFGTPEGFEEVQAYGEFFTFDTVGKAIRGIFKGTEIIDTQYGEQTYWRILKEDGTLYLIPENKKLERYRTVIEEGDELIIEYIEMKVSKKGKEFKEFLVLYKPHKTK